MFVPGPRTRLGRHAAICIAPAGLVLSVEPPGDGWNMWFWVESIRSRIVLRCATSVELAASGSCGDNLCDSGRLWMHWNVVVPDRNQKGGSFRH